MLSKSRFQALLAQTRKKRERERSGLFFVEGWRWLQEALERPEALRLVIAAPEVARNAAEQRWLDRARAEAPEFCWAAERQIQQLTGSTSTAGVAALVQWHPAPLLAGAIAAAQEAQMIVALDGVADPGNAGTIVRTADWFGVAGVVFGPGSAAPTNPKVVRATMGSLFHLPIATSESLAIELERWRASGGEVIGASLDGVPLPELRWPKRAALVIGNEASGLGPECLAEVGCRVRIPAHGRAESLNAAVAAAVLIADWRRTVGDSGAG